MRTLLFILVIMTHWVMFCIGFFLYCATGVAAYLTDSTYKLCHRLHPAWARKLLE